MKRILFLSAIIALTLVQCKKDIEVVPGEETDLENLLEGKINISSNLNERAPLSELATFTTSQPCRVTVEVKGEIPVSHTYTSYLTEHRVQILGLYADKANTVEITLTNIDNAYASQTFSIQTDPLPDYLPEIIIDRKMEGSMADGMHLAGLHLAGGNTFRTTPVIFDNNGDVRWILNLFELDEISWPIQRFSNGNIFVGNGKGVYEYSMVGEELNYWGIDGYRVHHDLIEMPNGNLLLSVQKYGSTINNGTEVVESSDDFALEFNTTSGAIVNEWDLRQVLDVDRHDFIDGGGDWFHMNALVYSEEDDCIIVSGRNQGVVKLNRDNEIVWIMSPHKGWGKGGENGEGAETTPFLLTAVNGSGTAYDNDVQMGDAKSGGFDWPWGQHSPYIMPNGNIFLFDNGTQRNFGTAASNYSRAVEYTVNENAMTVSQEWTYGEARGADIFSAIISDVDLLDNGNRLVSAGSVRDQAGGRGKIVEVNEAGSEVFEATLMYQDEGGTGEFIWGQFDIMYRAERMNLYP